MPITNSHDEYEHPVHVVILPAPDRINRFLNAMQLSSVPRPAIPIFSCG